jgi:hypothetical protein
MVLHIWNWLKDNDAPNWFVIFFSLIVWPVTLYWWSTRKRQNIPDFTVLPIGGQTIINGQHFPSVDLIFTNRTGHVVYLSRARLRECQRRFPIPLTIAKDISGGWREVKFAWKNPQHLNDDECILQTNDRVMTNMPVSQQMDNAFFAYRAGLFRRLFRWPKYFLLQYTAMVGEKKYSIETVY